jgi:hypothetical protein
MPTANIPVNYIYPGKHAPFQHSMRVMQELKINFILSEQSPVVTNTLVKQNKLHTW